MGVLFADPTPGYSDPAKTGYKVVDAGTARWAKPDAKRKALTAVPGWEAPQMEPDPYSLAVPPGPGGYQGGIDVRANVYPYVKDGDALRINVGLGGSAKGTYEAYSSTERLRILIVFDEVSPTSRPDVIRSIAEFPVLSDGEGSCTVHPDFGRAPENGLYRARLYQIPPSIGCGYLSDGGDTMTILDPSQSFDDVHEIDLGIILLYPYTG